MKKFIIIFCLLLLFTSCTQPSKENYQDFLSTLKTSQTNLYYSLKDIDKNGIDELHNSYVQPCHI